MIKIYSHPTALFVQNMKNVLSNHEIRSEVRREHISKNLDGMATNSWAELWLVDEDKLQKAKKIVDESIEGQANKDKISTDESSEWECPNCGETVDPSFAVCWNCQTQCP